jgi:hypothetical protein
MHTCIHEHALCDRRIEAWLFKAGKQADAVQRERACSPPRPGNCERRGALSVARFFDSDFPLSPFSFRCLFYLPACLSVATREAQADFSRPEDAPLLAPLSASLLKGSGERGEAE